MSLRKPEKLNQDEKKEIIINIGSDNHPYWKASVEPSFKNVELVRTPTPFSALKRSNSTAFSETLSFFKVKDINENFLSKKHPASGLSSPFSFKELKQAEDLYVISHY